jgi:hypothetical protein
MLVLRKKVAIFKHQRKEPPMSDLFTLNISGAWWDAHSETTFATIPQELVMKLAGEIRSWYESKPKSAQQYVSEVTVRSGVRSIQCPDLKSSIHVSIRTDARDFRGAIQIQSKSEGFIYDPETGLVGANHRDKGRTLTQSLDSTLRRLLGDQITRLEILRTHAQEAFDILDTLHPETKD